MTLAPADTHEAQTTPDVADWKVAETSPKGTISVREANRRAESERYAHELEIPKQVREFAYEVGTKGPRMLAARVGKVVAGNVFPEEFGIGSRHTLLPQGIVVTERTHSAWFMGEPMDTSGQGVLLRTPFSDLEQSNKFSGSVTISTKVVPNAVSVVRGGGRKTGDAVSVDFPRTPKVNAAHLQEAFQVAPRQALITKYVPRLAEALGNLSSGVDALGGVKHGWIHPSRTEGERPTVDADRLTLHMRPVVLSDTACVWETKDSDVKPRVVVMLRERLHSGEFTWHAATFLDSKDLSKQIDDWALGLQKEGRHPAVVEDYLRDKWDSEQEAPEKKPTKEDLLWDIELSESGMYGRYGAIATGLLHTELEGGYARFAVLPAGVGAALFNLKTGAFYCGMCDPHERRAFWGGGPELMADMLKDPHSGAFFSSVARVEETPDDAMRNRFGTLEPKEGYGEGNVFESDPSGVSIDGAGIVSPSAHRSGAGTLKRAVGRRTRYAEETILEPYQIPYAGAPRREYAVEGGPAMRVQRGSRDEERITLDKPSMESEGAVTESLRKTLPGHNPVTGEELEKWIPNLVASEVAEERVDYLLRGLHRSGWPEKAPFATFVYTEVVGSLKKQLGLNISHGSFTQRFEPLLLVPGKMYVLWDVRARGGEEDGKLLVFSNEDGKMKAKRFDTAMSGKAIDEWLRNLRDETKSLKLADEENIL